MNLHAPPLTLFLATACAGLFAGAASYVSGVEHPARVAAGTELAVHEFAPSYARGKRMQVALSLFGGLSGLAAFWVARDAWILTASAMLLALTPYTVIFLLPTSRKLLDPALDASSSLATDLLRRWGQRHVVRTALGTAAFGLLLWRLTLV